MATNNAINNSFYILRATVNGSVISDNLGSTLLNFNTSGGTPVNSIQVVNSNTGLSPYFKAVGSDTNVILQLQGQGTGGAAIEGTGTNDSASAGYVGEYVTSQIAYASRTSISNSTSTSLTSISLTAGDWDVWGNVYYTPTIGLLNAASGISTTNNTLPDNSLTTGISAATAIFLNGTALIAPTVRVSISSTTTVYVVGFAAFSAGTCTQSGYISARRVR